MKQSPITLPGLKLGQTANLLLGFKADWIVTDASTSPFYSPTSAALPTLDATITPAEAEAIWQLPRITLHQDTNSLLSAIYPYIVRSITGDTSQFSLPSGPLMVGDLDSDSILGKLSKYLGIDLTAGDSYILVELVRFVGTASHTYVAGTGESADEHMNEVGQTAIEKLPGVSEVPDTDSQFTHKEADLFLENFQAIGTHYVSKIFAGDRIFQVFAYKQTAFAEVSHAFKRSAGKNDYVDGISAISFQYYTTPAKLHGSVELGYVSQLGSVKMISNDPKFADSIKNGSWHDPIRAGGDSIFSLYQNDPKVDLSIFESVVPISFELTPLGNLIPVEKSAQGRRYWDRLLKGVMLQKYGTQVRVRFPAEHSYQWPELFPTSGSWLSTIATPTINAYNEHISLGEIQLINRSAVKTFSSWSVVLEFSNGTVELPGEFISLSSYFIDVTKSDEPPIIKLASEKAFDDIALSCGRMNGAFMLGYTGGTKRKTVMDGIVLASSSCTIGDTVRNSVITNGDLFGEQQPARLEPQTNNLNYLIVTCQTLLYSRGSLSADAQALARDCLVWLTNLIPNTDDTPQTLLAIRLRAAYLAHIARRLDEVGVAVPYLTYTSYKDYIHSMTTAANALNRTISQYQNQIAAQKSLELTAQTAQEINNNVKQSGNLLKQYIDAVATNQGDIATNYQNIINTKQRELSSAIANFNSLVEEVKKQQNAVLDAKNDFVRAVQQYQAVAIFQSVLDISTALFTVGTSIAIPATSLKALEELGETAQKIQKVLNVLNGLAKLGQTISGIVKNIVAVNSMLDTLKQTEMEMPTSTEWTVMGINFETSLAQAPLEVVGPKAQFVAAFKILVLKGQAMLTAQSKIVQLNSEIALNTAQKEINDKQQERLNKLTNALHYGDVSQAPDYTEVDLLSLTGYVQSQLNQIQASLAQALIVQDSAIQFELLALPTPIQRFDLNSLYIVMVSQQAQILAAKQSFNPPPFKVNNPIQVVIQGVPISAFTNGNTFEFQIQPSETQFQPYNMVRVQQVVVDIPSIKSSKSGQYRIDLAFQGDPFQDRDRTGQPLMFNTVTRYFGPFVYRADGHTLVSGDNTGAIADEITKITPFSTWRVKMPPMEVNEDIDFSSDLTVDIVLSFRIEALAQPALYRSLSDEGMTLEEVSHDQLVTAMRQRLTRLLAFDAAPASAPLDSTLEQMYKSQGVLQGWDCVLNMLEEPVNKFLAQQYEKKYSEAKPMTVSVGFCQPIAAGSNTILAYTKFSVELGPPLLQFLANNPGNVLVTQNIQSGYLQTGSVTCPGKGVKCPVPLNLDDPAIEWGDKENIEVSNKPTVKGSVALSLIQGLVTPKLPNGSDGGNKDDAHSVILDFAKGSFVVAKLNIDTDQAQLNLQLSNWFANNEIKYLINTIVYNTATTLESLRPSSFKLNTLQTNSQKNILQVFITTTGKQPTALTINVNEPIPDGYDNSLMINSAIMFRDIFVSSFNKGSSKLQVESIKPKDDFTAWQAKVVSGTVSGTPKFNNTNSRETRISANSNDVTWSLEGLLFSSTKDKGISLNYSAKKTVDFQSRTYKCVSAGQGLPYCYWDSWGNYSVEVDVALTGSYGLTVNDKNGKKEVQIASTPPDIDITPPNLNPTGPCECNNNDLKIQVGNILRDQVPAQLKNSISGITFAPVSVFALYNLLFPAENFIEMKSAYVPGDLVVFGTFNKNQ
ncbi:MACPF domain-containing protein [Nostoc sp. CHAB 5834]|nr:MACPF domain-containing protein [Nostoc sp. CHAB 5834]